MNSSINNHYEDLMTLCNTEGSSFYFVDQNKDDCVYRIFSYKIASYTEFCQPNARECRGHMYRLEGDDARLVALPPSKFFNADENPITMNLDYSDCDLIMDKLDGSLITTFIHNNQVSVKSKTSLHSEQAVAAYKLLNSTGFEPLKNFCSVMAKNNISISLEYTAPTNRIVIPHQKSDLTVLCARSLETGETMQHATLQALMQEYECSDKLVKNYAESLDDHNEFVASISTMKDIEGYVIRIRNGETVKIKTEWYKNLHSLADNFNNPKNLFICVVNEHHDDIKSNFANDEFKMNQIAKMEEKVRVIYRNIKENVEIFYNKNKHLDRKSYAILAQNEVPRLYFGLTMNMYLGKEVNYKEFITKNYKEFGIDEVTSSDN